ncbi:MAG: hypothetical protein ACREDR_31760 [Blastocatellia bacterium]
MSSLPLGVLIGGLISTITAVAITFMNNRSEERRKYKEIVINAAITQWKNAAELTTKTGGTVYPLDAFLVQMAMLSQIMLNRTIKPAEIPDLFRQYNEISDTIMTLKTARTGEIARNQ